MPFKKGQSGNPSGLPKNWVSRFCTLTAEERARMADEAGCTPLQFLMSIMIDTSRVLDQRIDAAKVAAPYFHRKMPIAIETDKPVLGLDLLALAKLPRPEREKLLKTLEKLGVTV